MSRQSTAAQRNLTLTEELEKLEQSITLTLQEIDHNFSRAHRIVTTSILPVVEQYAEHSKNVWEGSKFWKQFFEASANVSLSGYEEPPAEDDLTATEDYPTNATTPSTSTYGSPPQPQNDATRTPNNRHYPPDDAFSPSPTNSTPRPPKLKNTNLKPHPTTAPYSSPYETLKRETLGAQGSPSESTLPSTPRAQESLPSAPDSSPFAPPSTQAHTSRRTPANDILLHRVLDKNWRLQATPHSTARTLPYRINANEETPKANTAKRTQRPRWAEPDDLDSSPAMAPAPELHAEIFDTPARKSRTPGVSVLTPARPLANDRARASAAGRAKGNATTGGGERMWDSDDDDDFEAGGPMGGMSPPKTMQFHIPQGRLVKTPAREASKRIVEDLLLTAGGNITDEPEDEDDSPSVVKRGGMLEEDTF